jgi:hypothetical protein
MACGEAVDEKRQPRAWEPLEYAGCVWHGLNWLEQTMEILEWTPFEKTAVDQPVAGVRWEI